MNAVHLHLLLNHVPVLGVVFALGLLGFGLARGSEEVVRTALWTLAIVGVAGIVVYLTGEPAEEMVEGLPGVSEAILGRHQTAALWATAGGAMVGTGALFGLLRYRGRNTSRRFRTGILLITTLVAGIMGWTANLGGQVRHSELRAGATIAVGAAGRALAEDRDE